MSTFILNFKSRFKINNSMYHQVKILSSWILLVATVMLPVVTVEASASGAGMAVASRARHGGCNFRIGKISI